MRIDMIHNANNDTVGHLLLELVPVIATENMMTSTEKTTERVHRCSQLRIQAKAAGYFIQTEQGESCLQTGDEIVLSHLILSVQIYPLNTSINSTQPIAQPEPEYEDSWSLPHSRQAIASPVPQPLTDPIHQSDHYTQTDHLSFLYGEGKAVEYTSQDNTHNVLQALNINQESSMIINREYTTGHSTYLEQAPIDLLDEYLNLDEQEGLSGVSLPSSGIADAAHQREDRNFLSSVKNVLRGSTKDH